MSNLILGGLITLAGSAIVQVVIVPWVTTHRRRRERWEDVIIDLSALLEVELPAAADRLQASALTIRETRRRLSRFTVGGSERVAMQRVEDQSHADGLAASRSMVELHARMFRLLERAQSFHRSSAYWADLILRIGHLSIGLADVRYDAITDEKIDNVTFLERWDAVEDRLQAAQAILKEVSIDMRPPRTRPRVALRRWARATRMDVRKRRLTRRPE